MNDVQFEKMVKEALEHWDFESAENGADLKRGLQRMAAYPDGLADVFRANYLRPRRNRWDALDEMATVYSQL